MKRKLLSLVLAFAMTTSLLTVGASAAEPTYGDTVGHWAEGSIDRWSGHGIVQGSNGAFAPQRAHRPRARHGHIGTRDGHRAHRKSRFDEICRRRAGGLQQSVVAACFREVIEFYSL